MVSSNLCREQKRIVLWKKLHTLKTITKSKSVKTSSIIRDALLYILKLELQIEAITREYEELMAHMQDVKVEKTGSRFLVRVTCKKGEHLLVSIIEAFEKLDLMILRAETSCKHFFFMEAILEDEHQAVEVKDVTNAILMAIDM